MGGQVNDGYHRILWSGSLCPSSFHPEGTDTPLGCSSLPSPPRLFLLFIKPSSVSTLNPVPLLYLSLAVTLLTAWSPGPEIWWQPVSLSPIRCILRVLPCPSLLPYPSSPSQHPTRFSSCHSETSNPSLLWSLWLQAYSSGSTSAMATTRVK